MVIGAEFYHPSGLKHQGYAHQVEGYYQNPQKSSSYANMEEDYYAKDDCYNSSSSNINMKANPYMTSHPSRSSQPIKHGFVGQEGYAYQQDNYFGQAQKHKMHDIHGGYGNKHSNGMHLGEEGYYSHPPTGHYGVHSDGMHRNGSYETEHESYTHMGPNRYESASYDYHVEPPNYAHKNKKNWGATGAEWISKGL